MSFKKHQILLLPTNEKAENCLILKQGVGNKKLEYHKQYFTKDYLQSIYAKSYHLYILSDEEIKEGDWIIFTTPHGKTLIKQVKYCKYKDGINGKNRGEKPSLLIVITTCKERFHKDIKFPHPYFGGTFYADDKSEYEIKPNLCKKIIATTDKSLKLTIDGNRGDLLPDVSFDIELPEIPQSFIEHFVSEYNKSNIITEVMVEYYFDLDKTEKGQWIGGTQKKYLKINPDNTINIKLIKNSWNKKEQFENLIKFRNDYEKFKKDCHFGPNDKEIEKWTNEWIEQNL